MELVNAVRYFQASQLFTNMNMKNISKYLRQQSVDERTHAEGIIDFLSMRGVSCGVKCYSELSVPDCTQGKNPSEVMQVLLETEEQNYVSLLQVFQVARKVVDPASEAFLHGMITSQVAEIDKMRSIYLQTKAYDKMPGLLYHLDAIIR